MTVDRVQPATPPDHAQQSPTSTPPASGQTAKWFQPIALLVVLVGAIAAVWLTQPQRGAMVSSVSGLMTLKAAAQTAMPYRTAMTNGHPTLMEFYADWCTTCQGLAAPLQSVKAQFGDRLNFVMLDIDDPQWQAQTRQFQVSGVPHLVLLNDTQDVVDTWVGKVPAPVLTRRIAPLLASATDSH